MSMKVFVIHPYQRRSPSLVQPPDKMFVSASWSRRAATFSVLRRVALKFLSRERDDRLQTCILDD